MLKFRVSKTLRKVKQIRHQSSVYSLIDFGSCHSSSHGFRSIHQAYLQLRTLCFSSSLNTSSWIEDEDATVHASSLAITISGKGLKSLLNRRVLDRDNASANSGNVSFSREKTWNLHGTSGKENDVLSSEPPLTLYESKGKRNDGFSCDKPWIPNGNNGKGKNVTSCKPLSDSKENGNESVPFSCNPPPFFNENAKQDNASPWLLNGNGKEREKENEDGMAEKIGFFSCNGNSKDSSVNASEMHSPQKQISEKDDIMSFLKGCFESNEDLEDDILVNEKFFPFATPAFQMYFLEKFSLEMQKELQGMDPSEIRQKVIFPMFVAFCKEKFPEEIRRFTDLLESANMTKPHSVFPYARSIKRKIIYHYGPTNSGKTYNALQRFLYEPSGIYCSPLRLLAMEVYDYANSKGVPCSLITGQERKEMPSANHVSCTVEMASIQNVWKVAVIDEVQLLNDENRGWAWTRALLGLQAEEIHLCGDPSALGVVRNICLATGDELSECSYERFKPLAVDTNTLNGSFNNVEPGDCIVAFSRRDIFEIKRAVERATQKPCCVVYGALPPETRAQQAKLFNEPGSGYDILVASDAIGMGLNLNIRRIVFHTLEKFNGELMNNIPTSLIKQIAGRAGRRGSLYPEGLVTTFHLSDLPHLQLCLAQPFIDACNAGLFPSCEQLQIFADHMPNAKFSELLEKFIETSRVDAFYFLCKNKELMKIASVIDTVDNLTLEERFTFCFSPVSARDPKSIGALLQYARSYSKRIPLQLLIGRPSSSSGIDFQLMDLEDKYKLISLYLWLSQHFPPELFPHKKEGENMSMAIAQTLGQSLTGLHKNTG